MAALNFNAHLVTGTVTLERLNEVAHPPMLRSHISSLTTAHTALASGIVDADEARGSRKTALNDVVDADAALGASLNDLAGELVVARLGTLQQPFAAFGGKGVSRYATGSRVRAVKEVTLLLNTIRSSNPPEAVSAAVSKCAKECRAVTDAYTELGARRVAFRKARGARTEAFEQVTRALSDARLIAKVAWRDQPETYDIVFGAIEKDRFGKRARAKKKDESPQPSTQPTTSTAATVTTPPPTASATTPAASATSAARSPASPVITPVASTTNGATAPLAN